MPASQLFSPDIHVHPLVPGPDRRKAATLHTAHQKAEPAFPKDQRVRMHNEHQRRLQAPHRQIQALAMRVVKVRLYAAFHQLDPIDGPQIVQGIILAAVVQHDHPMKMPRKPANRPQANFDQLPRFKMRNDDGHLTPCHVVPCHFRRIAKVQSLSSG